MRLLSLLLVALFAAGVSPAAGQSLAALARKEEARRKQIKQASRVITNKDLRPTTGAPMPPPPPAAPAADAPAKPGDAARPGDAADDEEQKRADDEKTWRTRMSDARLALERSQMYADALQSKINALWTDFTARDDPAQRAKLEIERHRAIAEQERVKGEIEAQKKAIADLEEEARRAGVPPGWLR